MKPATFALAATLIASLLALPAVSSANLATNCGGGESAAAAKDIVDTASAAGTFKTLLAAAKAAGLVDTLKSAAPFTVFAPSDAAFAKLPKGTVAALLKDTKKLRAILTYHVVPGKVLARTARTLKRAKTVQGQTIAIKVSGKALHVNQAKVVAADINASNGVIHVIDQVIMPRFDKRAAKR